MALAAPSPDTGPDLIANAREATAAMEALLADATRAVAARVTKDGRISGKLLDREQRAAHGLVVVCDLRARRCASSAPMRSA